MSLRAIRLLLAVLVAAAMVVPVASSANSPALRASYPAAGEQAQERFVDNGESEVRFAAHTPLVLSA
jgi:hypothetical protein